MTDFKQKYSNEQRLLESSRIINKYPDRIPVICQHAIKDKVLPQIDKSKYLVPADLTVGQFAYVIRKRIKMNPEQALFLIINDNVMPVVSMTMSEIYTNHKSEDGFVYIYYMGENTFG